MRNHRPDSTKPEAQDFEIQVHQERFRVSRIADGTYDIFKNNIRIGNIYPDTIENMVIKWKSHQDLSASVVQSLGRAIDNKS